MRAISFTVSARQNPRVVADAAALEVRAVAAHRGSDVLIRKSSHCHVNQSVRRPTMVKLCAVRLARHQSDLGRPIHAGYFCSNWESAGYLMSDVRLRKNGRDRGKSGLYVITPSVKVASP